MESDSEKDLSGVQVPSFRLGFWRRHFSRGAAIAFAAFFSLIVAPVAFRHDSRENLVKLDGHITGLRYSPGAGSGSSGRIDFGLEEYGGARFRAEKMKEADELLFVAREKTDSYIQVFVEQSKWNSSSRPDFVPVIGLESSRGKYLVAPDVGTELSFDRVGASVALILLFGAMGFFGTRLRGAWISELKADPKTLETVVDPLLAGLATAPGLNKIKVALFEEARRIEGAEEARKRGSRANVEKASSKPMRAVEMLIRSGANLNAHNAKGETPLILAVKAGSQEAVQVLLKHHADPNLADGEGWTALMHAADQGELGICQRLLESGARVDPRRNDGKTAIELAEASQKKNPALVEALRRAATLSEAAARAKGTEAKDDKKEG